MCEGGASGRADAPAAEDAQWVFFDLDGTLIDSLPMLVGVFRAFLAKFGVAATGAEFEDLNGCSLADIISTLIRRHRLPGDALELRRDYERSLATAYATETAAMPQASDVLGQLAGAGVSLALVTATGRDLAATILERNGWTNVFNTTICGDELRKSKPHPDAYIRALEKSGARPDHVVVVEDSPNGVMSAKRAGLDVVAVAVWHDAVLLRDAGADIVVETLAEVAGIVANGTRR